MKRYKCYIFDVDYTLLDYGADKRDVFRALFAGEGMFLEPETLERLWERDGYWWTFHGLDRDGGAEAQRTYHERYRRFVRDELDEMRRCCGFLAPTDELVRRYWELMSRGRNAYPEARDVMRRLREDGAALYAATNGFETVQTARLYDFLPYLDGVFVSERIGVIKPNAGFWEHVFREVPFEPRECLVVGDSPAGDIASAAAFGADTFLVDRAGRYPASRAPYAARSLAPLAEREHG